MSDPFVGEIRMFGGNFAPNGFALCDGQLLAISQNNALFALLGTIYGGDGATTFALPDLRGRLPVHQGQGPGLSNRPIGSRSGQESATLNATQMPAHSHTFSADASNGTDSTPDPGRLLATAPGMRKFRTGGPIDNNLASGSVSNTGGGQAHVNVMPYQCVNFIIALFGVFPS